MSAPGRIVGKFSPRPALLEVGKLLAHFCLEGHNPVFPGVIDQVHQTFHSFALVESLSKMPTKERSERE